MSDTRKIVIRVTGMNVKDWDDGGQTITLEDGNTKYQFSSKKRDQTMTKAFEGYEQMGIRIGDTVTAEVSEEPASFTDPKSKKTVNYTKRRIMFFYNDEKVIQTEEPTTTSAPASRPGQHVETSSQLDRIENKIDRVLAHFTGVRKEAVKMPEPQEPSPVSDDEIPIINESDPNDEDNIRIEDVPF